MKNRNLPIHVCIRTSRKEVHEFNMKSLIVVEKLFLNDKHKVDRLAFANEHLYWTVEDWNRVIWIDEASFEIRKLSCQIWVWQRIYE